MQSNASRVNVESTRAEGLGFSPVLPTPTATTGSSPTVSIVFANLKGNVGDLAILGGGLSLYEALFLGVPTIALALPSVTPGRESHQLETTAKLAAAGACLDAGSAGELTANQLSKLITHLMDDESQHRALSVQGSELLDGYGLARTLTYIMELGDVPVNW